MKNQAKLSSPHPSPALGAVGAEAARKVGEAYGGGTRGGKGAPRCSWRRVNYWRGLRFDGAGVCMCRGIPASLWKQRSLMGPCPSVPSCFPHDFFCSFYFLIFSQVT